MDKLIRKGEIKDIDLIAKYNIAMQNKVFQCKIQYYKAKYSITI